MNISNSKGELLLVSDIEGCSLYNINKDTKQSLYFCTKNFFDNLDLFLKNKNNKIAFLGDYFDRGNYVLYSIDRIAKLKTRYKDRVYIILGNRDVNKFRLVFEFFDKKYDKTKKQEYFPFWSKYIDDINDYENYYQIGKSIMENTMGTKPIIPLNELLNYNLSIELLEKLTLVVIIYPYNKKVSDKILKSVDINNSLQKKVIKLRENFKKNVEIIYTQGKIADYDAEFKTFMSHSGGFSDKLLYFNGENITLNKNLGKSHFYYGELARIRNLLMGDIKGNKKFSDIKSLINYPNRLLHNTAKLVFSGEKVKMNKDYFILMCMCIRGDNDIKTASFISQCGISGNPRRLYKLMDSRELFDLLIINGCQVIAHGHMNFGLHIPLRYLYKYGKNRITFVLNDTTTLRPKKMLKGGTMKPAKYNKNDILPLSCIIKNGDTIKTNICILNDKGYLIELKENNLGNIVYKEKNLLGLFDMENNYIKQENNKLFLIKNKKKTKKIVHYNTKGYEPPNVFV
tara:strand:- start:3440 stop:4978 length:1539 start_codon:yes stop_codon:yes gene_type:complete